MAGRGERKPKTWREKVQGNVRVRSKYTHRNDPFRDMADWTGAERQALMDLDIQDIANDALDDCLEDWVWALRASAWWMQEAPRTARGEPMRKAVETEKANFWKNRWSHVFGHFAVKLGEGMPIEPRGVDVVTPREPLASPPDLAGFAKTTLDREAQRQESLARQLWFYCELPDGDRDDNNIKFGMKLIGLVDQHRVEVKRIQDRWNALYEGFGRGPHA